MSGGHFDYKCFEIRGFADDLRNELETNEHSYSEETLERLKVAQAIIGKAAQLAYEIEWLFSGDTGEVTFAKRFESIVNGAI